MLRSSLAVKMPVDSLKHAKNISQVDKEGIPSFKKFKSLKISASCNSLALARCCLHCKITHDVLYIHNVATNVEQQCTNG